MLVIPAINADNEEEAKAHISAAQGFSAWIHIDVSDGTYSSRVSWGSPEELSKVKGPSSAEATAGRQLSNVFFEVHLMINNPERVVEKWARSGAKKLIFHEETVKDFNRILGICRKYDVEPMLSVPLGGGLSDNAKLFSSFQILGVKPGFSGQELDPRAIAKVKLLRDKFPGARIEVDGGINPMTAKLVKFAGADAVASASHIFASGSPKEAYEELTQI